MNGTISIRSVGLIKSCWQQERAARPGAAEVAAFLADSPRLLAPCLDVPLDALPLDAHDDEWREARDRAEVRPEGRSHIHCVRTWTSDILNT